VVQPNSIGEIQALFNFSQKNQIPMVFRAAGTNLTGQAVTDGILVDISKHWDTHNIEDGGASIRAQPGIVGGFLNNALKPYRRRIGPDPASIDACMLGGILANNSGGMCCGVTENSYQTIQSMTIVFPSWTPPRQTPQNASRTSNRTSHRDYSKSGRESWQIQNWPHASVNAINPKTPTDIRYTPLWISTRRSTSSSI